jgi:very-short-patch-repair endonuclease
MRAPQITFQRAKRLRNEMTVPEVRLWLCLKGRQLEGLQFRKQHAIGPFILDFFCARAQLAVEVDGAHHGNEEQAAYDARRDAWLARRGIATLRIPAGAVLSGREAVLETIAQCARRRLSAG